MSLNGENNQNVWHVLQKIQTYCTQNKPGFPIRFDIDLINSKNDLQILYKLETWNVLQIQNKHLLENLSVSVFLTLQPNFSEIYSKFEKIHEENCIIHIQDQAVTRTDKSSNGYKLNQLQKTKENIYKQEKIYFSKYCLEQDVEHFESTLKHFFDIGSVSKEDFQFLGSYCKTVKTFLAGNIQIRKKRRIKKSKHIISDKQQPLPIVANVTVEGLKEGLEKLSQKSPQITGHKFPYKLPSGTSWQQITITFLNEEQIEIEVYRFKHITDFKEMGMVGKGKLPTPCEQWVFLRVLAKCYGELTIKDTEARDKYKKQKQALSNVLKDYFSIDYDPFYPYQSCHEKRGNSYKIKLVLIHPPPEKDIEQRNDYENDTDALGIHEFLNDQTTLVLDN